MGLPTLFPFLGGFPDYQFRLNQDLAFPGRTPRVLYQVQQQLCSQFPQFFLGMGNGSKLNPAVFCNKRIVIPSDGYLPRHIYLAFLQRLDDFYGNLVVITYNCVKLPALPHQFLHGGKGLHRPVLRVEPDNVVRVIKHPGFLQCPDKAPVPLAPLHVFCFKYPKDPLVPGGNKMLCQKVDPLSVIHFHLRLVLHLGKASLDKHIGNPVLLQTCIQGNMFAENLAFAWLDNQPLNVLLQQLL